MLKKLKNNYFLAFLFGAMGVFSLAPFNIFLSLIISLSGFYFLLEKADNSAKKSFWIGFFFGFGFFVTGIHWIAISLLVDVKKFAWLIPFAISIIPACLALYFAVLSLFYQKIIQKFVIRLDYQKIIILSCLIVIFEILRSYLFTGFAWNLYGYAMMFSIFAAQSAEFLGAYGLSFFACLFSFSAVLLLRRNRDNVIFFVILLLIFLANLLFGYCKIKNNPPKFENRKIRVVQANIKQDMKWDDYLKYRNFKKHISMSQIKDKSDIKAIIWPETAVPYILGRGKKIDKKLSDFVTQDQILITGSLRLETDETGKIVKDIYNSIFAINSKSQQVFYDKHHLVPFGEYVPLQRFLPFIEKITGGSGGFSSGDGPKTLEIEGLKFSPLVCYEIIFPDKIIDLSKRPDLLVNLTNDAWFGNSLGPYQHFAMTRMRAIEYGISVARAANSGISAYIDVNGQIMKKINLNESGYFDVKLVKKTPHATIFSQFKYFVILSVMLIFILILVIDRKLRNKINLKNKHQK